MSLLVGDEEEKAWASCLDKAFAMLPAKPVADTLIAAVSFKHLSSVEPHLHCYIIVFQRGTTGSTPSSEATAY